MKKGVLVEVIDVDIKSPYKGLQVSHVGWMGQRAKTGIGSSSGWIENGSPPDSLANSYFVDVVIINLLSFQ